MLESTMVLLLGVAIFALGILQQPFYDIGVVVVVIGLVGVVVRLGSFLRWLLGLLAPDGGSRE